MDIDKIIRQVIDLNIMYYDPDIQVPIRAAKHALRNNNKGWYDTLKVIRCLDSEPYWIIYDDDDDGLFAPFLFTFNVKQFIVNKEITRKYTSGDDPGVLPPKCNKVFIICSYNFDVCISFGYKGDMY